MIARFDDQDDMDKLRQFMGPPHIDQQLRTAIQTCWMMLPPGRRTIDGLEQEICRLVARAFRDMREDQDRFLADGDD